MRIDAHTHAMDADVDPVSRLPVPPVRAAWNDGDDPALQIEYARSYGIEKALLLDLPEITFYLHKVFGDFIVPVPNVDSDNTTPEDIQKFFDRGAEGIKFIAPKYSYGDDRYFPLYGAVYENRGLSIFHTGFIGFNCFRVGGLFGRDHEPDISLMTPSAVDRVARAFPNLKILMSHFGNPAWEEAWKIMSSHKNVYSDFSGGTAAKRDFSIWRTIFMPNGIRDDKAIAKLCFATDGGAITPKCYDDNAVIRFYDWFYDEMNLSSEVRERIDRGNILEMLNY